jgi:hypothetical protein
MLSLVGSEMCIRDSQWIREIGDGSFRRITEY